jgi:hypothetical protein
MYENRSAHNECVMALECEGAAFERPLKNHQNHTHQFVPSGSASKLRVARSNSHPSVGIGRFEPLVFAKP